MNGFDSLEELNIGEGGKYFKTTLLMTKNSTFPYIDYVIYVPESKRVIFKQITISTIATHLSCSKNDFVVFQEKNPNFENVGEIVKFLCYPIYGWEKELKVKGKGKSVCQVILELLFGKIEEYHVKFDDGVFMVFDGKKAFNIEIIYVTGTRRKENDLGSLPLKNIVCCYREELERLKIPF